MNRGRDTATSGCTVRHRGWMQARRCRRPSFCPGCRTSRRHRTRGTVQRSRCGSVRDRRSRCRWPSTDRVRRRTGDSCHRPPVAVPECDCQPGIRFLSPRRFPRKGPGCPRSVNTVTPLLERLGHHVVSDGSDRPHNDYPCADHQPRDAPDPRAPAFDRGRVPLLRFLVTYRPVSFSPVPRNPT